MKLVALALWMLALPTFAAEPDRWANAMQAFAADDAADPFPPGHVVFVGSSSIRLWDLPKAFPKLNPAPLNRGFGGSQISDSIRHFDLLVAKHKPKRVVMYAGDNDIKAGKSPEQVLADFQAFAKLLETKLPEAKLAFIAIKPSIARWNLAEPMATANRKISADCEKNERLEFIDIWPMMLGSDGRPRAALFAADGLHLNSEGYAIWTGSINVFLTQPSCSP